MMLSTSVLCMKKKKKKKTNCLTGEKNSHGYGSDKKSRCESGSTTAMLHVTEDTPPDMLAGAMDLAVHLPTGRSVKMSVERSTPMMDLLVQITTNHQLQLSNYTLQALGMAPSADRGDKILPYKPNTPIGTLDTQHIKVIPKSRSLPVTKAAAPGHQPFESTFRLKVHLPRNQLYVTRVSRNVLLEDIMKKVCEEKNLDPVKYEFKHPANLDEILDPKLTLSDYQITEIYVVSKGTVSISQAFSTSDIMALRKEEERKQMHNKTGGGVFNLIFRRGKSSMGSGSISSDTRSISPTHSDDSRSVTPPNVQQPILAPPPKKDPPTVRPKPPQRKRRPAPKPPQSTEEARRSSGDSRTATEDSRRGSEVSRTPTEAFRTSTEVFPTATEDSRTATEDSRTTAEDSRRTSQVSEVSELRRIDNGLVISHSRNSSDSSGYHEASVLSENCNASLPRRPKSAFVGAGETEKMSKVHSQSTTNLSKMASHSKSTTSLGMTGRKKKAAPPPPPAIRASNPSINLAAPSPVVASQPSLPIEAAPCTPQDFSIARSSNPVPLPRGKTRAPPVPVPRTGNAAVIGTTSDISRTVEKVDEIVVEESMEELHDAPKGSDERLDTSLRKGNSGREEEEKIVVKEKDSVASLKKENTLREPTSPEKKLENLQSQLQHNLFSSTISGNNQKEVFGAESTKGSEAVLLNDSEGKAVSEPVKSGKSVGSLGETEEVLLNAPSVSNYPQPAASSVELEAASPNAPNISPEKKLPEVVGVIPKTPEKKVSQSKFDTFGKRRLQVLSSLTTSFDEDSRSVHSNENKSSTLSSNTSLTSTLGSLNCVDDFSDLDETVFLRSKTKNSPDHNVFNQLFGIHGLEEVKLEKNQSVSSLTSLRSLPGFMSGGLKKWNNSEDLDSESVQSLGPSSNGGWVVGDSEPASLTSQQALDSLPSITSNDILPNLESKPFGSTDSGIAPEIHEKNEGEAFVTTTPPPPILDEDIVPPPDEKSIGKTPTEDLVIPPPIESVVEVTKEDILEEKASEAPEAIVAPAATETLEAKVAPAAIEVTEVTVAPAAVERQNEAADELDWHYQLPSPPKAFRDCSPAEVIETDFKDSVVTSPELFEKLKTLEDVQSERGTLTSDLTSVVSEEEVPLLNTLSLENLEKRRSLVYNRELTSLKMEGDKRVDTFSGSLTKFEATFSELQQQQQQQQQQKFVQKTTLVSNHVLPNFKISTYDRPKQKIKVFEDDTVRSSTDKSPGPRSTLQRSYVGRSMESISMRKNSAGEESTRSNEEYDFARPVAKRFEHSVSVFRSESFSKEPGVPSKPVLRSKSHVTLDGARYRVDGRGGNKEDGVSRSNSFYDLSGLQSLGVMRLIQNKLNTPTSSMENLAPQDKTQKPLPKPDPPKEPPQKQPLPQKQPPPQEPAPLKSPAPEKIYKYSGPPAINMSTWSERPKVPVSVAEDEDYTSGTNNNITSKLIVSTTNNNITSNNSIEVRDKQQGVSVKVNGTTEPAAPGNVVIKIGAFNSQPPKTIDNQRFINHTTAAGYRKPFGSLSNQRPHSIAFDSDFDISRVPVVRSVELKKPLKSTSVTQIHKEEPPKIPNKWQAPVVRGFSTNNSWNNRWSSYGTLPAQAKEKDSFVTNSQVPFGQATLRRTDSNKFVDRTNEDVQPPSRPDLVLENSSRTQVSKADVVKPPPPPTMPKVVLKKPAVRPLEPVVDQRDQLLSAIRNFGGKKGLRGVKA